MKRFSSLFPSVLLALSVGAASADTLTLASYGSTATAPAGVANSALIYAGGPTYNLTNIGVWAAPVGNSSWVGINPGDYPSGPHVEPSGTYTYTTTFSLGTNASSYSGYLTVMADDTTAVYLNNNELVLPAAADPATNCTVGLPTCTTPLTISLSGFTTGVNTLTFAVNQDFSNATGVDFGAAIGTTPEPNSLLLLGSGLTTMAGFAFRRRRA